MILTYLDEGGRDDVGRATLDVVEDTGLCRLDKSLATLEEEGTDPLRVVEVLGRAGDSVDWDGRVGELFVPNRAVGQLVNEAPGRDCRTYTGSGVGREDWPSRPNGTWGEEKRRVVRQRM